jgi:ATP-dependent DNA helicase RecQ
MNRDLQPAKDLLQNIWGYDEFRPPQEKVIEAILARKDTLIVLPTGGGKSICFQIPALLQTGLTLVVSPLVALMENQVRQLQEKNLPGALLHGELSRIEKKQTLRSIELQQLKLLYLSPETLLSKSIWELISQPQIEIASLVIDEVHCLIHWGTTFRPAYRRLGVVRNSLLQSKPPGSRIAIAAFTATADPQTQQEITSTLYLQQPQKFIIGPYRPNLHLQVKMVWTPQGRKQEVLKLIKAKNRESGLIYVRSRRDSETLATWLQSLGYRVAAYHAGLGTSERRSIEQNWLNETLQFVVCTSAFGMGIDKANVRWIVQYNAPELLAEYIQEIGRAGRDGNKAEALTLIGEPTGWLNPEDKRRSQYLREHLAQKYRQARQIASKIPDRAKIDAIAREFPNGELVLGILHSRGLISYLNPFDYQKKHPFNLKNLEIEPLLGQPMQQYLRTKQCRWQALLTVFDFTEKANNWRCGHCDRCLGK